MNCLKCGVQIFDKPAPGLNIKPCKFCGKPIEWLNMSKKESIFEELSKIVKETNTPAGEYTTHVDGTMTFKPFKSVKSL